MAKTTKMVEVPVSVLKPYANNAKKHGQEQLEKLKASIEEFGFLTPCVIDSDYNLIAGHGRVMAAQEMGIEAVPCVFVEGLSEEQRKAYILADNRLGELGEWDMDLVNTELQALDDAGFDASLTGFDWDSVATIETVEDGYTVEDVVKSGEIYQLGEHRLMCGDSSSQKDMDALFDGEPADMVFTDPPYGVAIGSKNAAINAVEPGRGGAH